MMQRFELELRIGETLQIGDRMVTIIDVDETELSVRIDPADNAFPAMSELAGHTEQDSAACLN